MNVLETVKDLTLRETQEVIIQAVEAGLDAGIRGPFGQWSELLDVTEEEANKPQWSVDIFKLDTSNDKS